MCPDCAPGRAARQAFYREEDTGPTITLPRRYRTKAVVLHELTHWALGMDSGLPHHGRTFARVLLDAVGEFCGPERATELAASYREHGVHVACRTACGARRSPPLRLGRTPPAGQGPRAGVSSSVDGAVAELVARFDGYERGSSVLRFTDADGRETHVATNTVWSVRDVG